MQSVVSSTARIMNCASFCPALTTLPKSPGRRAQMPRLGANLLLANAQGPSIANMHILCYFISKTSKYCQMLRRPGQSWQSSARMQISAGVPGRIVRVGIEET